MSSKEIDVLVIGSGTAGSNSTRAALRAGAKKVVMVHTPKIINTCVEEGCMPSKSILAGAHQGRSLETVIQERNAHIDRLLKALTDSFAADQLHIDIGHATFVDNHTVTITHTDGSTTVYWAASIVIATGSHSFTVPIPGLDTLGDKVILSHDLVSKEAQFATVPKRLLTIGGGPIGLELSTFFHDLGTEVDVLQRGAALGPYDPEFGEERVRASKDPNSFPIHLNAKLTSVRLDGDEIIATIVHSNTTIEKRYDLLLIATGRRPNIADIGLDQTDIEIDERGTISHTPSLQTSVPHIYLAGDVTGHHQILHFAAEMGKVAGYNAAVNTPEKVMDYDRHMLAVSFDQFPSALIGVTQKEAESRGVEVITATRHFNSIGLGILKRQEYGLWKVVAEKTTGKIIGSQILGPDSAGELIQLLVPIVYNRNTAADIIDMTWYHPTYAEILLSLARDLEQQRTT